MARGVLGGWECLGTLHVAGEWRILACCLSHTTGNPSCTGARGKAEGKADEGSLTRGREGGLMKRGAVTG